MKIYQYHFYSPTLWDKRRKAGDGVGGGGGGDKQAMEVLCD